MSLLYWGLMMLFILIGGISLIIWQYRKLKGLTSQLLSFKHRHANVEYALSSLSHQWRQPLHSMGFQLMRVEQNIKHNKDSQAVNLELLDQSQSSLQFMSETIKVFNDFLNESQPEAFFDPAVVVQQAVTLLQESFKCHFITVDLQLEYGLELMGNSMEFAHAVFNILSNIKDIVIEREIQQPTLQLSLVKSDNFIVITVMDNAGGIQIMPIQSIFNLGVSNKSHKDSGLGLYLSNKVISEQFSGQMTVSNDSEGAVFNIMIPYKKIRKSDFL